MPYRTYLTAPPGVEPTAATGPDADEPRERYVPGLAPVSEPTVPSRWRAPVVTLVVVAVIVAIVVAVLRTSAAQQAQDPSLLVPGQTEQDAPPSLRDGIPDTGGPSDPDGGPPADG